MIKKCLSKSKFGKVGDFFVNKSFYIIVIAIILVFLFSINHFPPALAEDIFHGFGGTGIICPYGCNHMRVSNVTLTSNVTVEFVSNATDDLNLTNGTLYIWNSTSDLIHTNTTNITGIFNETAWNYTFAYTGWYNWSVLYYDNDTNLNWTDEDVGVIIYNWTIFVDLDGPDLYVQSPSNATYNNGTINFNVTSGENVSWCGYSLDHGNNVTMTLYNTTLTNFTNNSITDGSHNITFTCNDTYNHLNSTSLRFFTVDTTFPLVSVVYPMNTTYNVNVSELNFTVLDTNLETCWYFNGTGNTTLICGDNATALISNEGSNTWIAYANDTAGNVNFSSVTFTKDTVDPHVNLSSPVNASTWTTSSTVDFIFNVTDATSSIANCSLVIEGGYAVNETTITKDALNTIQATLANAVYNWSVNCTDAANNVNASDTWEITVSYTAPADTGGGSSGGGSSSFPTETGLVITPEDSSGSVFPSTVNKNLVVTQKERSTITIRNPHDYDVNVIITLVDLEGIVELERKVVSLKAGEDKTVDINLQSIEAGTYSGKLEFAFSSGEKRTVIVEVNVKEEIQFSPEEGRGFYFWWVVLVLMAMGVILGIYYSARFFKRSKRKGAIRSLHREYTDRSFKSWLDPHI